MGSIGPPLVSSLLIEYTSPVPAFLRLVKSRERATHLKLNQADH